MIWDAIMADFDGRYRRERLLGAGGMGEVWLAFDEELGDRPVAIKMMRSRMLTEADDAARFQREMRLASRMQHPNILTVYTTGTDNGVPYMVMEYLVGRDLSKVPPGLDIGQVTRIGRETCAALACAHGLDVVHRDIKPGNLFLCDNGLTKVTDFGIAKAISGTKLSATGMLIGTLAYMAPEHWLGQPAAFSNDIWAVGCVLYELLSGRLPREYAAPMDYVAAAARRDRVVSLELIADVPPWLGAAVMAMLSPDPANRPTAADGVQLLAGPPAQAAPVPARPASAPPLVPPARPVVRASRPPGGPATAPGTSHPPTSPVRTPRPATPGRPRPKMRVRVLVPVAAGVVAAGVIAALVALPGGPQPTVARGSIVTADGVTIATTKPSSDQYKYQRVYPDGSPYAPVTGYDTIGTQSRSAGAAGVEHAENSLLAAGKTVKLTVNSQVQSVAYQQLQTVLRGELSNGKQAVGGVVALNPSTGAILALASYPSYDPNQLATHDAAALSAADKLLTSENPSPLLNNATQTPLPAGSTFSIVTSSAWYNQDSSRNPQVQVASPQPLTLPNENTLSNDNGETCGAGSPTTPVIYAFAQSCNTPFAEIGIKLGGQAIKSMATDYGLNNPSALSIPGVTVAPSNFTAEPDPSFTAFDAIGLHDTTATPLQEAMFAAAIADNGVLMRPYLIQQVQANGSVADQARPQRLSQPVSATIAGYEKQMMIAVMQQPEGTGYEFNQDNEGGLMIAGKTGTAQNGISATPDAVFAAFAPAEDPKIAVGIVIAGGGYGAAAAAPLAVAVIRTYLASSGGFVTRPGPSASGSPETQR
jgi:peptidoglycan glycosyltransferase